MSSTTLPRSTTPGSPRELRTAAERSARTRQTLLLVVLTVAALLFLFPFYWMLVTSLSPGAGSQTTAFRPWPQGFTLDNFRDAFSAQPLATWIRNSLVISTTAMVLSVVVSLMAGYALAKFTFRGRNSIFFVFLLTIMLPIQVTLVPAFLVVVKLGLVNSVWGVILPGVAEATGVFIARQFMLSLPGELMEAARIDGAGEFRIFWQIVLPLSRPLIGVLAILVFMTRWNEFLWPLTVLQGDDKLTLPVGLATLQGNDSIGAQWGPIMAVAVISVIPVLIVFLIFQRQFVQGIASSGIK